MKDSLMIKILIGILIITHLILIVLAAGNYILQTDFKCVEQKSIVLPIECLSNISAVNQLFDRLNITSVRVLTPEQFDDKMKEYVQDVNLSDIRLKT